MIWMEMKSNVQLVYDTLIDTFKKKYSYRHGKEGILFFDTFGKNFSVIKIGEKEPWNCIVIEYDDGEDGDAFYPEDYNSFDELLNRIVEEINAA